MGFNVTLKIMAALFALNVLFLPMKATFAPSLARAASSCEESIGYHFLLKSDFSDIKSKTNKNFIRKDVYVDWTRMIAQGLAIAVFFCIAAVFGTPKEQSRMISNYSGGFAGMSSRYPKSFKIVQKVFVVAKHSLDSGSRFNKCIRLLNDLQDSLQDENYKIELYSVEAMKSFILDFSKAFPNWPEEKSYLLRLIKEHEVDGAFTEKYYEDDEDAYYDDEDDEEYELPMRINIVPHKKQL